MSLAVSVKYSVTGLFSIMGNLSFYLLVSLSVSGYVLDSHYVTSLFSIMVDLSSYLLVSLPLSVDMC